MTINQKALRRLTAGAGALALAAAGIVAFGSAANAAVGPDQPGAPDEGTLTIWKYEGSQTPTPNPDDLIDGVEFTVQQVGIQSGGVCAPIDLTDAAQWDGLEGLFASAPAAPAAPFCLTDVEQSGDTVNGQVNFNLDVGVYFVQETDPGDNPIVSPVPNFYVSIPTSNGDTGEGWTYDVVAHPKNQLAEAPTKTIEGQVDLVVGGNVEWTMTVPIPSLNNDDVFDSASVTDVLDPRLSYDSSALSIGAVDLVEGTHYSVNEDGVTWTFLQDGLDLLFDHQGENLTVSLVTTVDEIGDGSIPNDEYSSQFNNATVPGTPVPYTYWGQMSILKTDDSTPARGLEGAEFQVFDAADDTGACPAEAPASGSIATGTSDANGVVQWTGVTPTNVLGLWVANSTDGPLTSPSKVYCVYETVVPAGHTATPFEPEVTITPGVDATQALTVVNAKKDGPALPLTGAQGTLVMLVLGLLVVASGAVVLHVARRRITVKTIQ